MREDVSTKNNFMMRFLCKCRHRLIIDQHRLLSPHHFLIAARCEKIWQCCCCSRSSSSPSVILVCRCMLDWVSIKSVSFFGRFRRAISSVNAFNWIKLFSFHGSEEKVLNTNYIEYNATNVEPWRVRSQKSRKSIMTFSWQTRDKRDRTSSGLYWHNVNKKACGVDKRFLALCLSARLRSFLPPFFFRFTRNQDEENRPKRRKEEWALLVRRTAAQVELVRQWVSPSSYLSLKCCSFRAHSSTTTRGRKHEHLASILLSMLWNEWDHIHLNDQ